MKKVTILVSGGGSVGLSLAAELGWRGINSLTIEHMNNLNMHPRANAVANRTMEYYRRWGIDEAISKAGVPPDLPANYYYVTTLAGRLLHGVKLPPFRELNKLAAQGGYAKNEHSWSPYLKTITGQHEVESAVLDFVKWQDSVDFRFGWELLDFDECNTGVCCRIGTSDGKVEEEVFCKFLVACDGGRSMVRSSLGIELSGRANLANFVSFYFRAPNFMQCHQFGHANIFFPVHRDHRGFLLNWDGGTTFTFHVILEDGQAWDEIDPIAAIHGVLGQPTEVEILSIQPWTAHALVADQYRRGLVFLAGDAAHLFSPTCGFGMNTGVSDVIDLAWKLQANLEGWAGPSLLDSYHQERRPIGIRNTTEAADCFDRLFAVMQESDVIDEDSPAGDEACARLKALIVQQEKLIASSGTLLGYRYGNSEIVVPDGSAEPPDDAREYAPIARPGHRAPHIWLEDGRSILDHFTQGFTLLVIGAAAADAEKPTQEIIFAADQIGLPLNVAPIPDEAAAILYEAQFALVRPDMMIAWRGHYLLSDTAAILDTVRGA